MGIELIDYLTRHFLTRAQLLAQSAVDEDDFVCWQNTGVQPQPSYRIRLDLHSSSFFGENTTAEQLEYYAKGQVAWLGVLSQCPSTSAAKQQFMQRYRSAWQRLQADFNLPSAEDALTHEILEEKWGYFIDGTFGLCTRYGLVEEIAAKSFAIQQINALIARPELTPDQLVLLEQAVNLLDQVAAEFAPHERATSSRQRLVNDVRRRYQLSVPRADM
ncbi:DUF6058 family natural product biosynthesis protein [Bacterioplanes sanyensis]|uniref:DUF6058 family natural product biosynthesis protein n=1 Tax=Bacterioplanes sanyensis TaxID=1249553 RepID=UPI0012FD8F28|nr:DUF6058 family natural product biosynthesis protein [Bacterioplanes sanyensis]